MFKRKPTAKAETNASPPGKPRRRINWLKVSIAGHIVTLLGIVLLIASVEVVHQSDTNPSFCASCHLMESHVTGYLTGDNLDHVHAEANVTCKDCHNYPLSEEIQAGIDYLTGNYEVDDSGELLKRDFGDQICAQCHGTMADVAISTDFLRFNPHNSGMGEFTCNTCHLSHGEQIDYCSECHTNGGQRMIGDTTPRKEQLGDSLPAPSPYGF